jgi:PQQ-like domain
MTGCGEDPATKPSLSRNRPRPPQALFAGGDVDVFTHHASVGSGNVNARTGANLKEQILYPGNVNTSQFGILWRRNVDDQVYAQPLHVRNVAIAKSPFPRNVVYVATQRNTLYAFDADNPGEHYPLWQTNLGPPVPHDGLGKQSVCTNIGNEVGITSTPVIDVAQNAMYVVHKEYAPCGTTYCHHFYLRKINIRNGSDVVPRVEILSGDLAAWNHNQRAALLLANNRLYIAFAGHCDAAPYQGYLLAYDANSLALLATFVTTNGGMGGGIWQSGNGPLADDVGKIYVMAGNSVALVNPTNNCWREGGPGYYADTLVQLSPDLMVLAAFVPPNVVSLCVRDLDFGSSGPVLLPGYPSGAAPWNLIAGGKEGSLFSLSTSNINIPPNSAIRILATDKAGDLTTPGQQMKNIHGAPVVWDGPNGRFVYVWPEESPLQGFRVLETSGEYDSTRTLYSHDASGVRIQAPICGTGCDTLMPGGILSLSAYTSTSGTGIVWASINASGSAVGEHRPGLLRAFDASDLRELWNSDMVAADHIVGFAKFVPPTVVNGQVFIPSFRIDASPDQLLTYGLKCPTACPAGQQCIKGSCQTAATCGDGYCSQFENATTCPSDCAGLKGCFSDSSTRALPLYLGDGKTIESCRTLAAANGKAYAGLQYFGQCFAGDSIGYSALDDSQCDTPCSENLGEGCGGVWANRIFDSTCPTGQCFCSRLHACTTSGDYSTDVNNCGGCCNVCPGTANGFPVCNAGTCTVGCNVPYTKCGNTCVNLNSDNANCGSCGAHCGTTEACGGGSCNPVCGPRNCL